MESELPRWTTQHLFECWHSRIVETVTSQKGTTTLDTSGLQTVGWVDLTAIAAFEMRQQAQTTAPRLADGTTDVVILATLPEVQTTTSSPVWRRNGQLAL